MTKIQNIIEEYEPEIKVPKKFAELEIGEYADLPLGEHHTETQDGHKIHVFTDKDDDGNGTEVIIDLIDYSVNSWIIENGMILPETFKGTKYNEEIDDFLIRQS